MQTIPSKNFHSPILHFKFSPILFFHKNIFLLEIHGNNGQINSPRCPSQLSLCNLCPFFVRFLPTLFYFTLSPYPKRAKFFYPRKVHTRVSGKWRAIAFAFSFHLVFYFFFFFFFPSFSFRSRPCRPSALAVCNF